MSNCKIYLQLFSEITRGHTFGMYAKVSEI